MTTHYPLLFTLLDKVEGKEYLADVKVYGRVLAEEDDGEWWMYGVNPGALAGTGKNRAEAFMDFRANLMKVLFDIAAEAENFYAFRTAARRFFDENDKQTIAEWDQAREQVRRGTVTIEGMRRDTAPMPPRIDITEKQTFNPQGNAVDPQLAVAA